MGRSLERRGVQVIRSKMKPLAVTLACFVALVASAASAQQDIAFPAGVTGGSTTISMTVYENANASPLAATVLAVHGFTETAKSWVPLKDALFSYPQTKQRVKRFIALDLTGHGKSPIPDLSPNNLFGNLTIYDNVGVIIQAIDYLRSQGMGPRVVMGHSMGGLELQSAQETLLSQGSSLAKHGVLRAILMAPVPVANISAWMPAATTLPDSYYRYDAGTYIVLDGPGSVYGGGFTTLDFFPGPCNPPDNSRSITPAACAFLAPGATDGLIGAEPSVTTAQLVGLLADPPYNLPRPSARKGAFALRNGTVMSVIGFSQDVLTPAALQPALYQHLLGRQGLLYHEIVANDAVHSMFITNPVGMLDQLFDWDNLF